MNKKTNQKRCVAILMAVTLLMSLAACKGKKAGNLSDTSLDRPLNIGVFGEPCELHFYAAQMLGLYEKAGYQVNWVHTLEPQALLVAGKIDITDGLLDGFVKPIEQGLDVKITTGLHQGCMSTIVAADSPYYTFADLKGKKIGAQGSVGAGTSAYIWRLLIKQGINPLADYEWAAFDPAAAFLAFSKGDVAALGMPDSMIWPMVKQGQARLISSLGTDPELADQTCCTLMASSKFAAQYPGVMKKLTEILIEASIYTETHKEEVVKYGFENGLIIYGTIEDGLEMAKTYQWNPGYQIGIDTFRSIFEDYQKVNIIDKSVSADKVLDKVFIKYDGIN